jgi:alpha-glucosidase
MLTSAILLQWLSLFLVFTAEGKDYELSSPDKRLILIVSVGERIDLEMIRDGRELVRIEDVSLDIEEQDSDFRYQVRKTSHWSFEGEQKPLIKEKNAVIVDHFNELKVLFKGGVELIFRAYDQGIAYRFNTNLDGPVQINRERARLVFNTTDTAWAQQEQSFRTAYEVPYLRTSINQVESDRYVLLPALVQKDDGVNILIAESDLEDYPGMWLQGTGSDALDIVFPTYPLEEVYTGSVYRHGIVGKRADFIARTTGTRSYPWRVFAIAENDGALINNQLVYLLSGESRIDDPSWITPGVVTFDWWGRRNIYGVDFKSGVNTATARHFIDFAAEFGFEYFLLDDGWTDNSDLFNVNPDLDIREVAQYAEERNVGLMLWLMWHTLDRQMTEALDLFQSWKVKGIKVDFMNRDDQKMVNFYHRIAEEAAKRHMVIDFHGAYKPAGLRKKYPNVLTREALIEVEQNGGKDWANPELHCLLPFIRMVAGPMDYIPGTMNNAQKKHFRPVPDYPMGLGTRAHDIALFGILESPMQMLPDGPSDYYRERHCTEFIAQIPVEWDETRVIEARLGDFVVLARRNAGVWYLSCITDWESRDFEVSLDFLGDGSWQLAMIRDGVNADQRAIDHIHEERVVSRDTTLKISLAPGGGWIGRFSLQNK